MVTIIPFQGILFRGQAVFNTEWYKINLLKPFRLRMKSVLLLLFLLGLACASGKSQITVDASTFPRPGDSLIICSDNLPVAIDLIGPGGPHNWNFSNLQAPFARRILIQDPEEGNASDLFPEATFTAEVPQLEGQGYFQVSSNRLELLGVSGPSIEGLSLDLNLRYNEPAVEKWAPLNYRDNRDHSFSFSVAVAFEVIAPLFSDTLPIQPDSVRITLDIDRNYEVDAWGSVLLPDASYPVLREKRTEVRRPTLEALLPVVGWVSLNSNLLPETFAEADTAIAYHFFNDEAKEPIAVVYTDDSGTNPILIEYKSNGVITNVQDQTQTQPGVVAYPNPAITQIRFDFSDLKPDTYTLKIYNVLGQPLWKKTYFLDQDRTEKVSLTRFKRGTYLYSLEDSTGKVITARRFIIIRP